MPLLTDNEKIILDRLQNSPYSRNFVANIIDRELSGARIRVNKPEKKAFILVERNYWVALNETEQELINQKVRWVMYLISISFGLVEFLDDCGFIRIRYADISDDISTIGPGLNDENAHKFEITKPVVVEYLVKYIDAAVEVLPTVNSIL